MFFNVLRMQLYELFRRKTVIVTYVILMVMVVINFISNMKVNMEMHYVSEMSDPIMKLILSGWSKTGNLLFQYFPILLAIPTGCAYLKDKDSRMKLFIETRCGKKLYWYSKAMAVFIVTFLVFTIPLLIEIMLSCICFDISSHGEPSGFAYIEYIKNPDNYPFYQLYVDNKILFGIVTSVLFGLAAAVLATFNFSLTTLPIFVFKIFTYFPIYIILYLISLLSKIFSLNFTIYYVDILSTFRYTPLSREYTIYAMVLLVLLICSYFLISAKVSRDDIL